MGQVEQNGTVSRGLGINIISLRDGPFWHHIFIKLKVSPSLQRPFWDVIESRSSAIFSIFCRPLMKKNVNCRVTDEMTNP